jgi:AAA domain-containing protein/TrwC relaxase
VLSISNGHSADYLTSAVAAGRENYYTGAVAAGEPPGRWYGRGAAALGLSGEVDAQDMTALYEHFLDPRDEAFRDPERWTDAATLGHTGRRYLSEEEIYQAALAAEPDAGAERRAALQVEAGKKARKNVTFHDATFSVQKSVTVLHAAFEYKEVRAQRAAESARDALAKLVDGSGADAPASGAPDADAPEAVRTGEVERLAAELDAAEREAEAFGDLRRAVEDAIWAGNQAAMAYLADKAGVSRAGHHGGAAGRWVDAHDWIVASFFQHDSRNRDPQLHIHNAILNRVQGPDGKWRTLDGKSLTRYRAAAAAVGERVMEHRLMRAIPGLEFATRPDGKCREIVGVVQSAIDRLSTRRRDITARTRPLVEAFKTHHGREPNPLELDHLQRQATLATRPAKSHDGETLAEQLDRWDGELRAAVGGGLAEVADQVLARADAAGPREPVRWSPREVIETATADIRETKAGYHPPDLTRTISDALPDYLGHDLDADQIPRLLDGLTAEGLEVAAIRLSADRPGEEVVPDDLRRADGTPVYQPPGAQLYATPDQVRSERLLAAASTECDAPALSGLSVDAFLTELSESGRELGVDQVAAVRGVLSSGARVETLVGPAGTGKSFVVGTLAKAWQDEALWDGQRRRVVGLASSQIAADVLTDEGLDAHNIARWLNAQDRLAGGSTQPTDLSWALGAGDLVVVDESAMANTADLARIHQVCDAAGAKLLLTGDHRQLSAVGAAGGMELVAGARLRHELSETRRFDEDWEGPASLRLRERDQTALEEYHKHGRLVDGGAAEQTEAAAREAWLADTHEGRRSLLIVDSNEQAATVSAALRSRLVDLGRVEETGAVALGLQGTYASRGDLIQARKNAWDLAGYAGNRRGPINRETFRVVATGDDGSLIVAPIAGRTADGEELGQELTLPAHYVNAHVALGYASTVHAAQGLTVDTSHTIVTQRTGADALYVGLSRGRQANTAYVVTRPVGDDAPTGEVNQAVHRSPQAMLAGLFEAEDPQLSALAAAAESAAEAESVRTPAELFRDGVERATANRAGVWLDELVADGTLTAQQRDRLAAEDGVTSLNTLLRRVELAGHDPKQRLIDAVRSRDLDDARQLTSVLNARIAAGGDLDPVGDTYTDRIPAVDHPQYATYLATLASTADARRDELGGAAVAEAPPWAVEALGPVPADEAARDDWQHKVGAVAAHRELMGHDAPDDALGPAPKAGQVEEYASWRTAWRALGRPEADRAEAEMSNGQLRVRVRAYEREKTWAPAYVANELAGTRQAAAKHRREATVRRAEAEQAAESDRRADLLQRADEADALAATLDEQAGVLDEADLARGAWYAHTAATRDAADRAQAELSARELDDDQVDDRATADEWIEAHAAAVEAEDAYREVHDEHEFAEGEAQRGQERQEAGLEEPPPAESAETAPVDIRQETADVVPDDDQHDAVRVPTEDETSDSVDRARRAVRELHDRAAVEEERAAEEARDVELATWRDRGPDTSHAETSRDTSTPAAEDSGPVLELSAYDD